MTHDQSLLLGIIAATAGLFLWGRWRHDVVAVGSLLACVAAGVVPSKDAFAGFGHPAVITVASVLVLSRGLESTGAVMAMAHRVIPSSASVTKTIAALVGMGAVLSSFMNNVGAMALLMPVAVQIADRHQIPPGKVLMPLAFGTILGGMTTLIGTPPNLIVSSFRVKDGVPSSFGMFDFTPVGLAVALAGVAFVASIGWKLVPSRKTDGTSTFDTGTYLTEARVHAGSKAAGMTLAEVEQALDTADAQVVGMVRGRHRVHAPNPARVLRLGDILVIEAEPEALASVLSRLGLKLEESMLPGSPAEFDEEDFDDDGPEAAGAASTGETKKAPKAASETESETKADAKTVPALPSAPAATPEGRSPEIQLQELVALPISDVVGKSASDLKLRSRYGLNLLAISRQGRRSITRLRSTDIQGGDVLLMQGTLDALSGFASEHACVPLAKRSIRIPVKGRAIAASIIMGLAIGGATFGLMPAAIAFTTGVLLYMAFRVMRPQEVYEAVDWSVIVLLGGLIPVAGAMGTTGAADVIAKFLLDGVAQGSTFGALTLLLLITMTLSDFMNNAATAAVMCPIAIGTAARLEVNADAFLMAVAIGASCAFLTPIGHQNSVMILGPGGFRFGDYWRLGLPLEFVVAIVGIPMLLLMWPI